MADDIRPDPDRGSDRDPDPDPDQELAVIEAMLRELTVDDLEPATPPASVWAGIELKVSADTSSDRIGGGPSWARRRVTVDPVDEHGTELAPPANVASIDARRAEHRRRSWVLAVAAGAVAIVVGAVAVLATRGGDGTVVAAAELTWDPKEFDPLGEDASARAELVEHDGTYEIVLTDTTLPTGIEQDEDLELWLISLDSSGVPADVQPVSLVDPTAPGRYAVPANLDPDAYTVVDISIEPRDGDQAHSGRSILRGPFASA